jgi:hypothetical protein
MGTVPIIFEGRFTTLKRGNEMQNLFTEIVIHAAAGKV